MMRWIWPCVKHIAVSWLVAFHAASGGVHCRIQNMDRITFDTTKKTIKPWTDLMTFLLGEMRSRSRQIDTFVNINVKKIWIHSP